jgi:hypothetical protein
MKNFKIQLLCLLCFFCTNSAFSQDAGVTTIKQIYACPGTFIDPVIIVGSPDIGGFDLNFQYDPNVFTSTGTYLLDFNSGLNSIGGTFNNSTQLIGSWMHKIISWMANSFPATIDINGTGTVFNLVMNMDPSFSGSNPIYLSGTGCNWYDGSVVPAPYNDMPKSLFYYDNNITSWNVIRGPNLQPSSAWANNNPLCNGSSTMLSALGGQITNNISWNGGAVNYTNYYWYTGSCAGNYVGTDISIIVSPTINTLYYVRIEGDCGITNCASVYIQVVTGSEYPKGITASVNPICQGQSTLLTVNTLLDIPLGTDALWYWYTGSCGGTLVGSSESVTFRQRPTVTTTYWVRAEGPCNTTTCSSITITVNSCKGLNTISNIDLNTDYMKISPNPANDVINIEYNITDNNFVNISMYNVIGEEIRNIVNKKQFIGVYFAKIDLNLIPNGNYTLKMTLNNKNSIINKIVVTK